MSKLLRTGVGVVSLCALTVPFAAAQDDILTLGASIQQAWDSNYTRTPEEDDEQITIASASVALNKTLSRQRFIARWRGNRYEHQERTELNATFHEGLLGWRGQWGSRLKTSLEWERDARPVDRLEFRDKDIVQRDDVRAEVGYGAGHRLSVGFGGRQTAQTHSNDLRVGLDFDEEEAFFETIYQTGVESSLSARVRYGERIHPNEMMIISSDEFEFVPGQLDFDYQQAEIQGTWVASPKTSLSATLAYFNRDGFVNTGSGTLALVEAEWEMSPKVQLTGGYSYKQPAVGETSDSPSDTHSLFLDMKWQWTAKISLGTGAHLVEHKYDGSSPGPVREETLYRVNPLLMTYDPSETFSIRLATAWTDRQSPLLYRDYSVTEATLGLFFRY